VRPTRLQIEGLTAFRSPQDIDFGELDLFVITGPTGSGKTSILDAMTFALYGSICRVKSGELRDLISHGATDVKVSLDFRVNGASYRVARRMRKAGQGHSVQFVEVEGDREVPVCDSSGVTAINSAIEGVLGLDFSAFTKAVLLPQGAFHEFLKGDAAARRKILVDLLDLNRYLSAGGRARSQANLLAARLDEREKLIVSEYGDATTDRLKEVRAEAKSAEAAYKELQSAEERAKVEADAVTGSESLIERASKAKGSFGQLAEDLQGFERELATLNDRQEADAAAVRAAAKAVKDAEKRASRADKGLAASIESGGDEATIALLQAAVESQATEIETLETLNAELAVLRAAVSKADEAHAGAIEAAKSAKISLTRARKEADAARAQLEHTQLVFEYAQAAADAQLARTELEIRQASRDEAISLAEAAQVHLQHLQQADLAATLRATLRSGDECPVCAQAVTTVPKTKRETLAALKRAKADAEAADKTRVDAERGYASIATTWATANERLSEAEATVAARFRKIPLERAEAQVQEAEASAAQANHHAEQAQAGLADAERQLAEADAAAREAKARAAGLEPQIVQAKDRLEKAEKELAAAFPAAPPADLEAELTARLTRLGEARREVEDATLTLTAAQSTNADALGAQRGSADDFADLARRFAETRARAEASLETLAGVSNVDLPPLPPSRNDLSLQLDELGTSCPRYVEAAQKAQADASLARENAFRALEELLETVQLEGSNDLTEVVARLADLREDAHATHVRADATVTLIKEKISKRADLENEIREDTIRVRRYRTLADELRADHFIAFVLEESMERLAALASVELLRVSDGRYSLVPEQSGFDVIDHHNADERRSVATLSGGETFLASLALALALAGSVRDLAGTAAAARLDAIFIDEGFGALDPETLDVVLDALERLREGERMVGVISHVAELAQRIPQGLAVSKQAGVSTVAVR
jgi:exonuclease SbcC